MRGRLYLKNAALLTAAGFALRVLGMVFRVRIAAWLGSEGMGLYQLILAVYTVFTALASAGVSTAATRLAAQSLARGQGMAATLRGVCVTALALGSAAMLAQTLLAGPVSRALLHDARAEPGLRVLAFSLPFIAVAGALRGCFLARRRVEPGIVAQLLEQAARMGVALALLKAVAHWGAAWGCAAVLFGNTVSEALSCAVVAAFAWREPAFRRRRGEQTPTHPYSERELWGIALPVTGSRLLASALQAAESSLIPACLAQYLGDRAAAMAQYGDLKGMAMPLLFFPFSVLAALSGLLMPEITRAAAKNDTAAVRRLVSRMLRLAGAFSLAAGLGFFVFGAPVAARLYGSAQVGGYVRVLALAAPFMYLESMVDGVLKGLGEQLATFRYSLLDSALRIAAILLLLPRYGMPAFLCIMVASNALTCALNTRRMLYLLKRAEAVPGAVPVTASAR